MTYFALSTIALLIPLNCLFSGLGVVVDRQAGAMRELLVAPIRRSTIVVGNLLATLLVTAVQVAVVILISALRGATYSTSLRAWWFVAAVLVFACLMYAIAEILATRLINPVEYTGALPAVAIVPYFFAGALYPITSLPHWLAAVARFLPITHAIALFRYGLTSNGVTALHNIWGMSSPTGMAALSLAVIVVYASAAVWGALRLFARTATS
jgi:ABC-2 type transport system permease protein